MKPQKGKGLPFSQINQIIKQFTEEKKMTQAQYMQLKFELIDKNCLTSQEYKEIFLQETKKKNPNQYSSMIKMQSDKKITNSFRDSPFPASRLTQSLINPIQKINDQLTLEMENTFQKKKNEQLKAQNQYLIKQLEDLRQLTGKNKKMFDDLKDIVNRLQKQLQEKEKIDKQQVSIINRLKKTCEDLQKELKDKGQTIKRLEDKVSRLQKQPEKPQQRIGNPKYLNYDEDNDESKTIQTMILPGHLLKEIAKPAAEALHAPPNNGFKKANKVQPPVVPVEQVKDQEEDLDDQAIQQMYSSRLAFDHEPRGCAKKYLPNLANFLTSDGFSKKNLNLIFRRNVGDQEPKGNPSDIFNRSSLLVLICTRMNQIIGGFTQIQIQKGQHDYIKDSSAFIFSLNKNQKFKIKKNSVAEAIFITQEYLICFSNDLMIPVDCIKSQSHSDWPTAYEYGSEKRNSKWLTGQDGGFSIKEIEIYEVKEEAMTIDL